MYLPKSPWQHRRCGDELSILPGLFLGVVAFAPGRCRGVQATPGLQPGVAELCSGVGGAQKLFLGIHEQVSPRIRPKLIPECRGLLPALLEMLGPQTSPLEGGRACVRAEKRPCWSGCGSGSWLWGRGECGAGGAGCGRCPRGRSSRSCQFSPAQGRALGRPRAAVGLRADPGSLSAAASPGALVQGPVVPWLPAG